MVALKILDVVDLVYVLREQARVAEAARVEVAEEVLRSVAPLCYDARQRPATLQRDGEGLGHILSKRSGIPAEHEVKSTRQYVAWTSLWLLLGTIQKGRPH